MLNVRRFLIGLILSGLVFCAFSDNQNQHHDEKRDEFDHEDSEQIPNENPEENQPKLGQPDWCQFNNGTKIPFGFTFLSSACTICECTATRKIRCSLLQCLPTYCVDDSMPTRLQGQCCAQCKYEQPGTSCSYNNLTFPHGVVVRSIQGKMQCWCQMGQIECRNYLGSLLEGFNILAEGTVIYMIVLVLGALLLFGLLACCGCTILIYTHYQRNQAEYQAAYDQYVNEAGWQPVEDAEQSDVEQIDLDKEAEAQKVQDNDDCILDDAAPPYTPPQNFAEQKS